MLKDAAYRENIWKSKINLSFVTQFNEEDVAHKAFEIAACRGFLLALRTPGHQACFEEGREAEFFSSIEECADKIRYYLDHSAEREGIAARGCERAAQSGYDNETQLSRVLQKLHQQRELPSRSSVD
jgi:spore maturation protein CgeB